MLTHLFKPAICAECRLCCHFRPASVWETPFLEDFVCEEMEARGVELCSRENGSRSFVLHFETDSPEETANCPLLDPAKGCTIPREQRPFECRVWPLRLMYDGEGRLCIGCYRDCTALQDGEVWEQLKEYAKGELLPTMRDYASRFPQSIRPFNPAYAIIWQEAELAGE